MSWRRTRGGVDAHAAIGRGHGADQRHDDHRDRERGAEVVENRYGQQPALHAHPGSPPLALRSSTSAAVDHQLAVLMDAAGLRPDPSDRLRQRPDRLSAPIPPVFAWSGAAHPPDRAFASRANPRLLPAWRGTAGREDIARGTAARGKEIG